MQVNAISNQIQFNGLKNKKSNHSNSTSELKTVKYDQFSNASITNATKALALATLLTGATVLNSCNKDDEAHYHYNENTVNPEENKYTKEYIYVLDTIPGTNTVDTVKIKPGYDSPVSPIIKEKWETLDIDTGNGKIITSEQWFDNYATQFVKDSLNLDRSSKSEMVFDAVTTGWDDNEDAIVLGKNDSPLRLRKMATSDGNLLIKMEVPRDLNNITDDEKDWKIHGYYMQKIEPDTVWRYKIDDDNNARKIGYMVKGDEKNTVRNVNFNDAEYKYSDINVVSKDVEDEILDD